MSVVVLLLVIVCLGFLVVFLGRPATLVAVLAVLAYKALSISIFSCSIEDIRFFRALQAMDFLFVMTVTMTVLVVSRPVRDSVLSIRTLSGRNMLIIGGILAGGALTGLLLNPFDHFAIYLRLLFYPLMLYVIGTWLGRTLDLRTAAMLVVFTLLPVALLVLIEFVVRAPYHDLINSSCYQSLRLGRSSQWYRLEDVMLFSTSRLYNIELFGDILVAKPYGTTLNYPSTSYLLLLGLLASWLVRRYILLVLFLVATLLMTTKASLFMLLSLLAVPVIVRRFESRLRNGLVWGWLLGFGVLATAWLVLTGRNLHAYSLLASLASVPGHPLGNGIGWGGSLSVQEVSYTWDSEMLIGDSGLAILLNMLGVAGFAVFLLYAQVFVREAVTAGTQAGGRERLLVATFGIGVIGNAVLQELAVGPYAAGLAVLMLAIAQRHALGRMDASSRSRH
jgi:hypothetical protein